MTSLLLNQNAPVYILDCSNNKLGALSLVNDTALQPFNCTNNLLTLLNLCKNTNLTTIDCANNNLTDILVNMGGKSIHLLGQQRLCRTRQRRFYNILNLLCKSNPKNRVRI